MALLNTSLFTILSAARQAKTAADGTKEAFTPSPAIAQAVMQQAQGGGGDPSMGGGDPSAGGVPPGMDPAAMGAAMGQGPGPGGGAPPAPPGPAGDPSAGAGGGSADPALAAKLDQILQQLQQQGGGQGGVGPNGKPNTASVKFEPQHFHQIQHDLSNIKSVMVQLADAMGLQVPASAMIQQPAPGAPAPTDPNQAGAQGAAPAGGQPTGPPPSNVAQQLPSLPPAAQKAATDLGRLANGFRVPRDPEPKRAKKAGTAAGIARLASLRLGKKG